MQLPDKLKPFAKAIAPAVLTLIAVGVDWLILGNFQRQTLAIAVTGLGAAIVTYFVPNAQPLIAPTTTPKPTTAPKPTTTRKGHNK
jgi:hypothetical protein